MPTLQEGQLTRASYKVQSALGTPAIGASGIGIRYDAGTAGMEFDRVVINNDESFSDGMARKGRLGSGRSTGSFGGKLSVGTWNDWIEAALRVTRTATFNITEATTLGGSAAATSITTTTSTIVAAAGSWILQGVQKGMKVKLANHSTAANNGKWFRVVDVSALTITVDGTPLTLNATPDTSFTLAVAMYMINGNPPVGRYFTIDQYYKTLDLSKEFDDVRVCKMELNAQPDALVKITFTLMGLAGTAKTTGTSPVHTDPVTYTTSIPLVLSDAAIRIGGVTYTILTGFTLTYDMGGSAPATNALNPPDVALDNAQISGSFTAFLADLAWFTASVAETTVDFFCDFIEGADADPKDFISWYVGNATLSKESGALGSTGFMPVTVPWFGGKDEAGGANAPTMVLVTSSV